MKKLIIGAIALILSVSLKAQFLTIQTAKNSDPLSNIRKVEFDSTTKIITIFDASDNWAFMPIKFSKTKNGYEVTAKSATESLFFLVSLQGSSISQIAAFDSRNKEVWRIK